ncbi:MAG: cytochrome c family protein [Proteobacteria bacterium]|nr:cytochrome c family protein [Pseudomonadota bacterium]
MALVITAIISLITLATTWQKAPHNQSLTPQKVPTVMFGDLRGYFESCGCHPVTDLGGVERLGALISRTRFHHPELEVFSTGNNFKPGQFTIENRFIQKALELIAPSAMLFGLSEMAHLAHLKSHNNLEGYLLTHDRLARQYGLQKVVRTKSSLVFGLLYDQKNNLYPDAKDLAFMAREIARAKKTKTPHRKRIILLLATTEPSEFLHRYQDPLKAIDIIFKTYPKPLDTPDPGVTQHRPVAPMLLYPEMNKLILSSFLNGQSVITLHLQHQPEAYKESLNLHSLWRAHQNKQTFTPHIMQGVLYQWLTANTGTTPGLENLKKEYGLVKQQRFQNKVQQKLGHLVASHYVGSEVCQGCHQSAYEQWLTSGHSKAYATLKAQQQHENELCVACHVVALHSKGGYTSSIYTPHLKNVGCESCHGPRKDHVLKFHGVSQTDNTSPPTNSAWQCTKCHHPPHTANFNQSEAWLKISHGF